MRCPTVPATAAPAQPPAAARRPAPPARAAARWRSPGSTAGGGRRRGAILPLGLAGIDRALPGGGLRRGCLHELHGAPRQAAALGFAVALLGRLMAAAGHAVWIGPRDELFAPGLAALGLAPERLIVVRARGARPPCLWALEEALRSPGLVAALAEVERLDLTASRRLQLAAEAQGVTALLLRPPLAAGAGRRRARPPPAGGSPHCRRPAGAGRALGPPRWRVELLRCRGGRTGVWQVGWREEGWHEIADPVLVAADARDRPAAQAGPRSAAAAAAPDSGAGGGRAPLRPERPLATFVSQNGALRLAAVCARARAAGLAPGMMLADARALLPPLQVHPAEPAADARLLDDLLAWCERYTPWSRSIAAPRMRPAGRSGSTSPAARICSAARRRCAPTCSPGSTGRASPPPPGSPTAPAPPGPRRALPTPGREIVPPDGAGRRARPACRSRRCASSPSSPRCSSASASPGSATSTPCPARR